MRLLLDTTDKPAITLSVQKTFYSIPFRNTVDIYTASDTTNWFVVLDAGFSHETELSVFQSEEKGACFFRLATRKAFSKQRVVNPILTVDKEIDDEAQKRVHADVRSFGMHLKNLGCGNFITSDDVTYESICKPSSSEAFRLPNSFEECRTTLPPPSHFFKAAGRAWNRKTLIYRKK
tara:strand:+ start:769 stop:1299 length:531 start_codon:yes stop_codon:yes gene_type:complete